MIYIKHDILDYLTTLIYLLIVSFYFIVFKIMFHVGAPITYYELKSIIL